MKNKTEQPWDSCMEPVDSGNAPDVNYLNFNHGVASFKSDPESVKAKEIPQLNIPLRYRGVKELNWGEKALLAFICILRIKTGFCYASNEYLAKCAEVSSGTLANMLTALKRKKYISIKKTLYMRRIYLLK